jgi:3-oxoacyl-[acyl-carrier-protein] synthase II
MEREVVVTGIGSVSPIGLSVKETLTSIQTNRSGIQDYKVDLIPEKYHVAGWVKDFRGEDHFSQKDLIRYPRFIQLALKAAEEAVTLAKLSKTEEKSGGVFLGVGIGGLDFFEQQMKNLRTQGFKSVSPFCIPSFIPNMAAGVIAKTFHFTGTNISTTTACASGAHAIGEAYEHIKSGKLDQALVGGAESALSPGGFAGFGRMKAISEKKNPVQKTSCPFDKERSGFVMGEGAGVLILEEKKQALKRGAPIFAELVGYGASADAYHMTSPHPSGKGAQKAMRLACEKISPEQLDYINAHGTSTKLNDQIETMSIKAVFGAHAHQLKVSSTKSATGHLLGAAGGVEAVLTVLSLKHQLIPATLNYETPDPECDLNYVPRTAIQQKITYALSNSFGFGGTNACLLFKRFQ